MDRFTVTVAGNNYYVIDNAPDAVSTMAVCSLRSAAKLIAVLLNHHNSEPEMPKSSTPAGSWETMLPALLSLIQHGGPSQVRFATNELRRMAQVADAQAWSAQNG